MPFVRLNCLLLVPLIALLALIPASAFAVERQRQTIELDETVVLPASICGFDIVRHREGFVQVTTVYAENGTVEAVITREHIHGTFSANGTSLSFVQAATYRDVPTRMARSPSSAMGSRE